MSMLEQNSGRKTYPGSAQVAMSLSQQAHSRRTISCAQRRDTSPGKWLGQKKPTKKNKRRVVTPTNNTCQGAAAAPCLQSCCRALRGFLSCAKPLWGIPLSRQSRPRKHSPEAVRSAPPAALWHISPRGVFLETIAATIADDMVIFPTRLHQQDRLLQRPCSNYKESRCAAGGKEEEEEEREEAGQQSEMLHPRVTSALPQSGKKSLRSSKVATYGSLFV